MSLPRLFLVAVSVFGLQLSAFCTAADRAADWRAVEKAEAGRLPKDASAALDRIITSAMADRAWSEAVKAILQKIQTDASVEDRRSQAAYAIRALDAWCAGTPPADAGGAARPALPPEMRPLLEAALAKTWWAYYQANRWQLLERTRTAAAPSDDFLTWDAPRVLAEAARHFEAALADPAALQRTPVAALEPLLALPRDTLPDVYRPTLYDFLVHEAIAFYSAGEQGVPKPADRFDPDADSPLLGPLEEFLAWQPGSGGMGDPPMDGVPRRQSSDPTGGTPVPPDPTGFDPTLRVIQLYQQLLRFHQADPTPRPALADADLARLNWAAAVLGDPARERHQAALRSFVKHWEKHHVATTACLQLAEVFGEQNPADMRAAALEGVRLHPSAPAANACRNIIASIEAPVLTGISTEHTWAEPRPDIIVRYRNLKKIYFRALPIDWDNVVAGEIPGPDSDEFQVASRAPAKAWSVSLPATTDFRIRDQKLLAPRDLKPGFYVIVASIDEAFSCKNNLVIGTGVWVSDLAIVTDSVDGNQISGLVVNAITGEPVPGALVTAWNRFQHVGSGNATTDEQGAFAFTPMITDKRYRSFDLHARTIDGREIATRATIHVGDARRPVETYERDHVYFFTDRSIYRPGQAIHFKVIGLRTNNTYTSHSLLAAHDITVLLRDPNGRTADTLKLRTNGFGSASGSFTIPAGTLTGQYQLSPLGLEQGSTTFRVEEYKRPKFEVTLDAPKNAPRLDDVVMVNGSAISYTGAPIDGAKVTWRVRRLVRWPRWCAWFMPRIGEREISQGSVTTDAAGGFTLKFTALPDKSADPKNEPVFDYAITAEVTDATGETRDANRVVTVGYTALAADVSANAWQTSEKPVILTLSTTSLDGMGRPAKGTVTIYSLQQPESVPQPRLRGEWRPLPLSYADKKSPPPDDIRGWPEDDVVTRQKFSTDAQTGKTNVFVDLAPGIYRAEVATRDYFGKAVTARTEIRVLDPDAARHDIKEAFSLTAPKWNVRPGETFVAYWGSGYESARAFVSIELDEKILCRYWTEPNVTRQKISLAVTEEMRGGVTLRMFQVRDNRLVSISRRIEVPWDNKELKITWEHFNSKLIPGGHETWTAKITGPDATVAAAEMVAALYDASLDQFYPHDWTDIVSIFPFNRSFRDFELLTNNISRFGELDDTREEREELDEHPMTYRQWAILPFAFTRTQISHVFGLPEASYASAARQNGELITMDAFVVATSVGGMRMSADSGYAAAVSTEMNDDDGTGYDKAQSLPVLPDLTAVAARKNLQETAFFFPQLLADADGSVRIEFTVPEALTRWKFLGFAHDKELRSAVLTDTAITAKDLMVQPNPPRFLREGDTVEFTVKLTNMTDAPQSGTARLTFADATTLEPVTLSSGGTTSFTLPANSSTTLSWRITVPDGQGFLTYKAVATTGAVSDGEEGFLPVLSRRRLVTESIALPIRDAGTRTFRFDKLASSSADAALRNESLTVQMTSNPAWHAVLALPMLMEFPHECSEQLFNRYYANALAAHIANSDPRIARVFEQWRNTPATDSSLLRNEDLKSVLIEETPWLRAATRESERRRALALLFDASRTAAQTGSILRTLAERQLADGLWSWFPGGSGSDYITRYLVAGFARLRHFGIPPDQRTDTMLKRAVSALDAKIAERHAKLLAQKNFDPEPRHLESDDVFQLYTRSFFTKQIPVPANALAAYDFFAAQTRAHWPELPRQSQGHAALALARSGDSDTALAIVASLRQRAKTDPELGMGWADADRGWFWWQAPVETQALMIEVFDEVARDSQAVADLQLWLLKQKQTSAWPSTKATADAVYALLLRGADKLASDALVTVTLGDGSGGMGVPPVSENQHGRDARATQPTRAIAKAEPGTGYYSERIPGALVIPAMGEKITVTKTDAGPAWGSVTWQYFQAIDTITPHEGTPLTLKKSIWKQTRTGAGPTLVPLTNTTLNPGDTLVVRLELRTDRDMEFVHLKDQRGSGTEPVNVLSGYRWRSGLGYYESTRDTATHFFIDRLPRGTHVFEYPIRVQLRGEYESGLAEIQCMYAPEYNSHSASVALTVE